MSGADKGETAGGGALRFDFSGKRVVITGGNKGLGAGVAAGFIAAGAAVTVIGLERDTPAAAAAMGAAQGISCDIADAASVKAMAAGLAPFDILINNAGLELITPIEDPDPAVDETFRRITEINVIGTFTVTRALLPLIRDGGRIVNTASMWGKTAVAAFSAYCASKHAVIGLTRALAWELAPRGVAVNAVCPGWVRTEASLRSLAAMSARSGRPEEDLLDEITGAQAFGGLMVPGDMAATYMFLASEAAANVTGQSWTVDRGESQQ